MTRPYRLFVSLALSLAPAARAAPLTLKETIQYALGHSPLLEAERQREAIGELKRENARTKFLPSLDLSAQHGLAPMHPKAPSDPWASSVALTLSETLYDNGKSLTEYRISEINRDLAALARKRAEEALCLDVSQRFYRLSLGMKLREVKETQLGLYQKQFRFVDEQFKQGLKAKKEYLRFRSQAQRAEIDARDARVQVERAAIELRNAVGVPAIAAGGEPLTFALYEPELGPDDVPDAGPALRSALDFQLADLRRQVSPYEVQLAKREYYPTVGLTLGANYNNSGYLGSRAGFGAGEQYGVSALVTVGINFLDWGLRARNVEIAERSREIEENNFRKAANDVRAELDGLMLDLSQLRANHRMTEELLALEEESFGAVKREYREGKVTPYDFILSLNDLLDAKTRFYNTLYGLAEGLAKYHFYEGNLHETLSVD